MTTPQSSPPQSSDADTVQGVVAALREVIGRQTTPVEPHEPILDGNEAAYLRECVETRWVSSGGPFVTRFEAMLAETLDVPDAIAVSTGTAALHTALVTLGVAPSDEVLTPALNFVAAASAIKLAGAVPHFVDCDPATLSIDPEALEAYLGRVSVRRDGATINAETGRRLAALICLHPFGHAAPVEAYVQIAEAHGLPLIEDAAEALGSRLGGRHLGTFGRAGILSFNGNKIVTTGGGGALMFARPDDAVHARHLTVTAKRPHAWEFIHDEVGFNYRMPNVNAALGCAQLERLPHFLARKRVLAARYEAALAGVPGVSFLHEPEGSESNYWLCTIVLEAGRLRDLLLQAAREAGFNLRPVWQPMHRLAPYADCPHMPLPGTDSVADRVVNLPSSANL